MTTDTDIDPAFAARCEAAAVALRQLVELGARHDTDASAVACATSLTETLLADPEALLAVALTIEQGRAGERVLKGPFEVTPGGAIVPAAIVGAEDPRFVETRRLRDKLRDVYGELPPAADDDPRIAAVIAEIRAVWA